MIAITTTMMTATQIGDTLGLSARKVNLLLLNKNVIKKQGKVYELTKAGEQYGETYSFVSGGLKTITSIKYHKSVIDLLRSDVVLTGDLTVNNDDLPF